MPSDLFEIVILIGLMLFPLVMVFLVLMTLDWNRRRNLFYDSWFVYLAWLAVTICYFFPDFGGSSYLITKTFANLVLFFSSVLILQTVAVAAVLHWLVKRKYGPLAIIEMETERPKVRGIWKTAILVSSLTSLMMLGLTVALDDLNDLHQPHVPGEIEFGVYDISR